MGLLRTISVGALAGGIATGAMTAFMFGVWRQNPMGQKPLERITEGVLDRVGVPRSEESQDVLASLLHIAFGMGGGATFALIVSTGPFPSRASCRAFCSAAASGRSATGGGCPISI